MITDLVMPDTTGMDLAGYVRENNPDIGLILMSGYPSIATALDPAKLGVHAYLEKPFSPEDLKATVDTCTAAATARRLRTRGSRSPADDGDGVRGEYLRLASRAYEPSYIETVQGELAERIETINF